MNEKEKETEKVINVPLDPGTKAALETRAKANGRQTCREAAAIIKSAVREGAPEAGVARGHEATAKQCYAEQRQSRA